MKSSRQEHPYLALSRCFCDSAMAFPAQRKRKVPPSQNSVTDDSDDVSESSSKKSKPNGQRITGQGTGIVRNSISYPPTTSPRGLYNASLFQLQIEELLLNVQSDYELRMVEAEKALRKLRRIIERIPSREPISVCNRLRIPRLIFANFELPRRC